MRSRPPSWRALLPELVERDDLSAASALNGVEFNLARAVGPAQGGLLVAAAGAAFAVNAASFLGVILVILRWKQPQLVHIAPAETLGGATAAALRYVRYSPAIRTLLLRAGGAMFFATALIALLPTVAHAISTKSLSYGLLLGSFGAGAVLGALPRARDPDTLSFTHALRVTRRTLPHLAAIPPQDRPAAHQAILRELRAERVSASRGRVVPRGVKRKMSNFPLRPRRRQRTRRVNYRVRLLK